MRLSIILLLLSPSFLTATELARTLSLGSVQDELRIDQSWEHFEILRDYIESNGKSGLDHDSLLRKSLSPKQLARLQQIAVQVALHNSQLHKACRLLGLSTLEEKRFKSLMDEASLSMEPTQQEMVFRLRKEHLNIIINDDQIDVVCGADLHMPVIKLYTGRESDRHAVGVDWFRCATNSNVGRSIKLSVSQRRQLSTFQMTQLKEYLKVESKLFKQADADLKLLSPVGAIREAIRDRYNTDPNYKKFSNKERREENRKIALKVTKGKDLQQLMAEFKRELYKPIDAKAKFIRDFMEELLTEKQMREVKQRIVQSAMIHGSSGLPHALRQVGIDMKRDANAYQEFAPFNDDVTIEAMEFHVRSRFYQEAFERVIGASRFAKLTGKRHVFTGPFGEIPDMSSDLFSVDISTKRMNQNPRRIH